VAGQDRGGILLEIIRFKAGDDGREGNHLTAPHRPDALPAKRVHPGVAGLPVRSTFTQTGKARLRRTTVRFRRAKPVQSDRRRREWLRQHLGFPGRNLLRPRISRDM
jgi:hypothetical protein